jgi:redox-sensitive bicupin YhaK (pirin superfamily)
MPAITADTTTLPRLTETPSDRRSRPVRSITTAPAAFEGEGFPVRRAFAGVDLADLDPFIHMDQMGAVDYGPGEPRGTSWHPHRGFETVTYMLDGAMQHQDSHGGGGLIRDGDTQWMTAGRGILHIETPPEKLVISGGLFHGIQLWVNLPSRDKMIEPRYQGLAGDEVVLLSSPDGGALLRVVAGAVDGHVGPGATHTPITFVHATLAAGAHLDVPWDPPSNALVYVLSGQGTVGPDAASIRGGQLALLGAGDHLSLTADAPPATTEPTLEVLLLGGRPIGEPVAAYGPFVMNTRAELQQAVDDFNAGRLGLVPPDALMPYRPR